MCNHSRRVLVETTLFAVDNLFRSSAVRVIVSKTCIGEGGPPGLSLPCPSEPGSDMLFGGDASALTISNVKDDGVADGDSSSTGSLKGF